jgi:hypothetical protein
MAGGLLRLEGLIMSGRWKNIRRLSKTRRLAKLRMLGKIRISVADLDCFDMDSDTIITYAGPKPARSE